MMISRTENIVSCFQVIRKPKTYHILHRPVLSVGANEDYLVGAAVARCGRTAEPPETPAPGIPAESLMAGCRRETIEPVECEPRYCYISLAKETRQVF